jgi:hypothetical protein
VVYVEDGIELDFSAWVLGEKLVLEVPGGVTLAGGVANPASSRPAPQRRLCDPALIRAMGGRVASRAGHPRAGYQDPPRALHRWIVEDEKRVGKRERYYAFPTSDASRARIPAGGRQLRHLGLGPWGGVLARGDRCPHPPQLHHHNQRAALATAWCSISGGPHRKQRFPLHRPPSRPRGPGTSYEAANNLVRENAIRPPVRHAWRARPQNGTEIAATG